ncbi:LysR family transcriptional regulator [Burkholderia seminalis]|uniref:helix-turn-helix domain-containing protein n=1 Tax=Burkholderia seminalis TaxID=488731 RepID=UPI0031E1CD9F
MDPNLLPLLPAAAKERNFRAVADRMGVTRSAVGQGIRRLRLTHAAPRESPRDGRHI